MGVKSRTPSLGWKMQVSATNQSIGEIYIYDDISAYEDWWSGDVVTPTKFKEQLDALGPVSQLNVYINSNGGDVFAGQAIHSMLSRHDAEVHVYVDGLAASIASVVAMAGDKVIMPANAMMMIHNPWTMIWDIPMGNEADFRRWAERCNKMAEDLNKIRESCIAAYMKRCTCTRDELVAMLDAETWLTADECKSFGMCDEVEGAKQVAASLNGRTLVMNGREFDLSYFRHTPKLDAAPLAGRLPAEPVVDAGRSLSKKNEEKIRGARDLLDEVLADVDEDGEGGENAANRTAPPTTEPRDKSGSNVQRSPSVAPLSLFERQLLMNERRLGR